MGGVGLAIGSMIAGAGIVILISHFRGGPLLPQIPLDFTPEELLELGFSREQIQRVIDAGLLPPFRDITIVVPDGGEVFITQVDL